MSGSRVDESTHCPDCGAAIPHRDPLVGWWLCDDCELAVDGDGERIG